MELRRALSTAEIDAPASVVCVTGATRSVYEGKVLLNPQSQFSVRRRCSYVGGAIIARLLAAGHTVHGTCRDPSNKKKLQHLLDLPGAGARLKLFQVRVQGLQV